MKIKQIMAATLITATMATTAPMAATTAAAATTTASTTAATTTAKTWKDTKYSKPLTRYTSKANVKVRSGATSTSKVVKTYKKGVKLTIVGKTNTGYFKLKDGNYVLITSVTKTKPGTTTNNKTTTKTNNPYTKYVTNNDFDTLNLKISEHGYRYNENDKWAESTREHYYDVVTGEYTASGAATGWGWHVANAKEDWSPDSPNRFPFAPVYDKLTVGKDIPYGLYMVNISSSGTNDNCAAYIKDSKGNIKWKTKDLNLMDAPIYYYLENGDTISMTTGLLGQLTPVLNGSEEYECYMEKGKYVTEEMTHYFANYYVSSKSALKPGTYKIEEAPTNDWGTQHSVIIYKHYFKEVLPCAMKTNETGDDWDAISVNNKRFAYISYDEINSLSKECVGSKYTGIEGGYTGPYTVKNNVYFNSTDYDASGNMTITVEEDDLVLCHGMKVIY